MLDYLGQKYLPSHTLKRVYDSQAAVPILGTQEGGASKDEARFDKIDSPFRTLDTQSAAWSASPINSLNHRKGKTKHSPGSLLQLGIQTRALVLWRSSKAFHIQQTFPLKHIHGMRVQ